MSGPADGAPSGDLPQAEIHHDHKDVSGGWLRAAVFGAMDGLVSNLALISGMAGGSAAASTVALAGVAGLAAGAFSMAAGEYVSVKSQNELAEHEISVERAEILARPEAELAELAETYVARGVDPALALEVAKQISVDPERAVRTHAMLELGVDPTQLASPLVAAGSSFVAFSIGAVIPLLPYLFGASSLWPAVVLASIGLFAAGALVAQVTARTWWFSGLRQLGFGLGAAALTYLVGALVGVAV